MENDAAGNEDTRSLIARYFTAETMDRAAELALQQRRARGDIMTYVLDGWVVREYPGQRIERLAPNGQFRAHDFPVVP